MEKVKVALFEMFQSRVDWTDPRTPEEASAAPIGNPETLRLRYCRYFPSYAKMRDSCDSMGGGIGCARG